jgi:hypothetical protein
MDISLLFQQLGIALGLALLVGLQRESAASPLAGVRTFRWSRFWEQSVVSCRKRSAVGFWRRESLRWR